MEPESSRTHSRPPTCRDDTRLSFAQASQWRPKTHLESSAPISSMTAFKAPMVSVFVVSFLTEDVEAVSSKAPMFCCFCFSHQSCSLCPYFLQKRHSPSNFLELLSFQALLLPLVFFVFPLPEPLSFLS